MGWLCCPLLLKCCQLLSCGAKFSLRTTEAAVKVVSQVFSLFAVWTHQCGKSGSFPKGRVDTGISQQQAKAFKMHLTPYG